MTTLINIFGWIPQEFLSIGNFFLTLIFVSFILRSKKPPGSTLAWLLFIIAIPYVGIPFYIFFSGRKFKTKFQKKATLFKPRLINESGSANSVERILESLGSPPARLNQEALIISTGASAYSEMVKLLELAQSSICLTTFIFSDDAVGNSILELLTKKVNQGVSVRILLDSLGASWVRHPSFKEFKSTGGQIGYFMPFFHLPLSGRYNLRNHRKILIVDSQIAILGGMNIAEVYMGPSTDHTRWVDLGIKVEGSSVQDIESIFVNDWYFATGEALKTPAEIKNVGSHPLQIVPSGPDVIEDPLYDSLLTLIYRAQRRIWVATPYFIPDESLARALELAARRGVDVRILIPKKSNHFLADAARGSYVRQLIKSGCHFHFLLKMMHAKAFLVDDDYAHIGSANFDMRSLLYNYEVGIFISAKSDIASLEKWFTKYLGDCDQAILASDFWIDLIEGVGRVLGPLI